MSAADAAAEEWRRARAAKKLVKGAGSVVGAFSAETAEGSLGAVPAAAALPRVQIPDGVAIVGEDKEAAEVLFRQLGKGYVEQLEALQRDGALGSDSMRTMHEKAETEVKMQVARAGARISDILQVVTSYMSRVHSMVTGVAEQQRALFASAVEAIVDDGPMRLHMLFTDIAKREIQKRMEQAERSMDGGSTFYRAAQQAGTLDVGQSESEFWQQKIQEAEGRARREAEQANEQVRAQLQVQIKENEQTEKKIQQIADAHHKKTAAAVNAYELLAEELAHSEAQSVLEFKQKSEEKKKVKRLEMVNKSMKDEIEQLTENAQTVEEALSATREILHTVQKAAGTHWKTLKFTRTLLGAESLQKSLNYQTQLEDTGKAEQARGAEQQPNSPGLDAFLKLNTAHKIACTIQRNYRRRREVREQELLLKVCLRLQRWTRGNIARKALAARVAAEAAARLEERDAMLAKLKDQISDDTTTGAPLLGIIRAATKARNKLKRSTHKNDVGEAESDDDVPNYGASEEMPEPEAKLGVTSAVEHPQNACVDQSGEDQAWMSAVVDEVGREAALQSHRLNRPSGGGVEEALWWSEVAQAIRELRDQVQSDSEQRDVRSADLRAQQEKLRAYHKQDHSQAVKLAETVDQMQDLAEKASKNGLSGRDAAKERQRRILQRAHTDARKEYIRAIQDTKSQQDAVTTAVKIHDAQTRAESQRLHWLRQLPLLVVQGSEYDSIPREGASGESTLGEDATYSRRTCTSPPPEAQAEVEDRPQAKETHARSIRFAPLKFIDQGETVIQVLREGAEVRPYSETGANVDTSKTYENVPYSATDGGVQVDLRSLITARDPGGAPVDSTDTSRADDRMLEGDHHVLASDRRGGILKEPTGESSRSNTPRPASASSCAISQGMEMVSRRRPMSARPNIAAGRSRELFVKPRPRSAGDATSKSLAAYVTPGQSYTARPCGFYQVEMCASRSRRQLVSGHLPAHMDSMSVATISVEGRRTALRPQPPRGKLLESEAWPVHRQGRA
jgi:hypothetical protein